jgi:hypothetical protein
MALIIRLDIDRPYGRRPPVRHLLSRLSSDLYFPKVAAFGFLGELETMLNLLNEERARAYIFFRRCTLPSKSILELMDAGRHEVGLHLEDSRSLTSFLEEMRLVERHVGRKILAVSKHGSGGARFGFHHYAPYEPDKYVEWAQQASMQLFLGNLQDPTIEPTKTGSDFRFFPSAFWLEPHWRDAKRFTVDWLLDAARSRDIVLLVHPENVLANSGLVADFRKLIRTLESRLFQ